MSNGFEKFSNYRGKLIINHHQHGLISHAKFSVLGGLMRSAFLLVVVILFSIPVVAQPLRPPNPTDISGEWNQVNHEEDTAVQPPLCQYLGLPFNDAGRIRAETTAESIWGTPEYLCRPHSAP